MVAASWTSSLDLETPAGRILCAFIHQLPQNRQFTITVFGSAPIQIMVDPHLLSGDVDVFSTAEDLAQLVSDACLDQAHTDFYIEVLSELNFRTSHLWKDRTKTLMLDNVTLVLPHPIDILIAKGL